ncbi:hypothetical protein A2U01_0084039, partial [Trifolium medium]|nr:hypothetical protein [Trifolium medium]
QRTMQSSGESKTTNPELCWIPGGTTDAETSGNTTSKSPKF